VKHKYKANAKFKTLNANKRNILEKKNYLIHRIFIAITTPAVNGFPFYCVQYELPTTLQKSALDTTGPLKFMQYLLLV
jgi:hypothetical protein